MMKDDQTLSEMTSSLTYSVSRLVSLLVVGTVVDLRKKTETLKRVEKRDPKAKGLMQVLLVLVEHLSTDVARRGS